MHRLRCGVPSFYILMSNKSEAFYWYASQFLIVLSVALGCKLSSSSITCHFERGVMNIYKDQFWDVELNVFLHFKQAMRRKMALVKLSRIKLRLQCMKIAFTFLKIIPRDKMNLKKIP